MGKLIDLFLTPAFHLFMRKKISAEDAESLEKHLNDLEDVLRRFSETTKTPIPGQRKKVKCEICARGFEKITSSHLKTHGLSVMEYKRQFPNASLIGEQITIGDYLK